jgi:proton-dependent oligopeptide transporter, POT family
MNGQSETTKETAKRPLFSTEGYRTSPDQETENWPPGIPFIVGNEVCERFSFYGMKALLYLHLTSLFVLSGELENTAKNLATSTTHLFNASVYALPMIGAIMADRLIGKYRTIFYLSLVYCAGHAVLAFAENTLLGMYVGLGLIAVGSGGIKPCVAANVGDQFGKANWFRVRTIFQVFYFSVNFGSFFSTLSIPYTRQQFGPKVAFAIPGVLMFMATALFWMGRKKFVHIPPKPGGKIGLLDTLSSASLFMAVGHLFFTSHYEVWVMLTVSVFFLVVGLGLFLVRQRLASDDGFLAITLFAVKEFFSGGRNVPFRESSGISQPSSLARSRFWGKAVQRFGQEATEGPVAVFKIISVFFLVSVFWALFDQHASSWIRQAEMMNLHLWGDKVVLSNQIQSLNPLLVMILIPVMNIVYSFFDNRGIKTTPLRRITVGMFIASLSFVAVALIQKWIDAKGEGKVWFAWQVFPFLLITIAEVMVSITGLEFAYTQAPRRMKSMVMSFWNLTVALGNVLIAFLASFEDLPLTDFFWVFAGLMAGAGFIFGIRSYFYVPKDFTQL